MNYYNIDDISKILGISRHAAVYKLEKINLEKSKILTKEQVSKIDDKTEILFYPLKTTVTYHIYESKMNYD